MAVTNPFSSPPSSPAPSPRSSPPPVPFARLPAIGDPDEHSAARTRTHPLEDTRLLASPTSPSMSDYSPPPLTTSQHQSRAAVRSVSSASFVSSPLNPASPPHVNPFARSVSSRPASRSSNHLSKFGAYDDPLLPHHTGSSVPAGFGNRGSMILYRLADERDRPPSALLAGSFAHGSDRDSLLVPPRFPNNRDSVLSNSGDSIVSFSSESKYPSGFHGTQRGLIAYPYDPSQDETDAPDDEDLLHDPSEKGGLKGDKGAFPWRGILNVSVLILLILALLTLFVFYPVMTFYRDQGRNARIEGNIRVNQTGQAPVLFQMPELIDVDTPAEAHSRTGFDGQEYDLVFSDEFEKDGRTFYPGDDPFWEAVDLWYGATGDVEWYDPSQVTTRDGHLVITMDSVSTTQAGLTPGSTAPFTVADNHGLEYRSGMLQSWNKFCFTTGYIEVSVVFPGPDENTQGYWPGAWTMGNLARPGYPATTDGMWPYTYDSCDVGTFPNQTNPDGQGPPAALFSSASRDKYNNELSWLSGQRLSACSCPGADHPGPVYNKGRGAPEIDIFEAEKDKDGGPGQVVSQSAQFAPFTHDYLYDDSTNANHQIFDTSRTRANTYHGSAVQQSVSSLTRVPSDMFQGAGKNFKTFGFEYWSDPDQPTQGYIEWQVDGSPSHRVGPGAVGPDQGSGGSGVGQRLIPLEPMSIVLNLGMSPNWQTIDLSSMMFPSEFLIDYVRVYQRKDQGNIGCDPQKFPTADYIKNHIDAYMDQNMTTWQWPLPKNGLYSGGC